MFGIWVFLAVAAAALVYAAVKVRRDLISNRRGVAIVRLFIVVASPLLFWLAWAISNLGLRGAWDGLTVASAWTYAHNGVFHALVASIFLLVLSAAFLIALRLSSRR